MERRAVPWHRKLVHALVLVALVFVTPRLAGAIEEIHTEEDVADLLAERPAPTEEPRGRQWAVLPQIGFGPDTGPVGGLKFTHRDVGGEGVTVDVDATAALEGQQDLNVVVGTPHLLDDRFLAVLRLRYYFDPEQEFFGVGNNEVGPDPASTHSYKQQDAELTFGWRPWHHLAVDFNAALRLVKIGRGNAFTDPARPFTLDAFPDLPGVHGGRVNPLGLSLVYTSRDDPIDPKSGWRAILKVAHTDRALGSDFEFTRVDADVGYLYPLRGGAHV